MRDIVVNPFLIYYILCRIKFKMHMRMVRACLLIIFTILASLFDEAQSNTIYGVSVQILTICCVM
jgi:hypothetical protein